jgi:SAM-dependent methyltransferase
MTNCNESLKKGNKKIKQYWDNDTTESMYDKNLLEIEIQAIFDQLEKTDRVFDIGCGEGEGTTKYSEKVKELIALDYSINRLGKLRAKNDKICTIRMDMRDISLKTIGRQFDKIITQRALINLSNFEEQKQVIKNIHTLIVDGGKYLMIEGFNDGTDQINQLRTRFNLPPIQVKWHNCFLNKTELLEFISPYFTVEYNRDFSTYFFITRVFNAILKYPEVPQWNDNVNNLAREMEIAFKNQFIRGLSRLEFIVLRKNK